MVYKVCKGFSYKNTNCQILEKNLEIKKVLRLSYKKACNDLKFSGLVSGPQGT